MIQETERARTRDEIRAMPIEQVERGVSTCKRNLIAVEAEIAAKTQALASITAMGARHAFKRLSVLGEIESLSSRKADIEWLQGEYTQRVGEREHKAAKQTLKKLRTEAGLTQGGLASTVGIDESSLGRIERGRQKPSPGTARAIADALSGKLSRPVHPADLLPE
jgi:DNA-binding XRE family transcriptional regulator